MPRLSLGLGAQTIRKVGGGAAIPQSGLSLWLKADAGVTTTPEQFISQIVLTGAGTTTSNGTYTRTSGGTTFFASGGANSIGFDSLEEGNYLFFVYDDDLQDTSYSVLMSNTQIISINTSNGSAPVPSASITLSNGTQMEVTGWADQSGNGRNASPVDVNPAYNSSGLNSKPTISLSSVAGGTNKSLEISGNPMGASGATAFVVNYVDPDVFPIDGVGGDANGALLGNFGSAANGSHWPYGLTATASVYDSFATDTRKDDLGLPTGITSWNIYSVHSQDNNWKLFCNGTEFHSDSSNVYSNAIANDTSLYIGMQNNAGTDQIFKGKVAEIIVYNRVLATGERQQVEAYLNAKYAIY